MSTFYLVNASLQLMDILLMDTQVPMIRSPTCDFSYAGLKTAVLRTVQHHAPGLATDANRQVGFMLPLSGSAVALSALIWQGTLTASQHWQCNFHSVLQLPAGARRHCSQFPIGGSQAAGAAVPARHCLGARDVPRHHVRRGWHMLQHVMWCS